MHRLLLVLALALCPAIALAAINLNTASRDELVALPGIGPAKAQAILDYRKAHGGFKSVDELKDVKGIGARRFEKLKPELTVGGPSTTKPDAKSDGRAEAKPTAPSRTAQGGVAAAARREAASGGGKP